MEFSEISKRALEVRAKYSELEKKKYGREWSREEIFQGFVGDVGSLAKSVMVEAKIRQTKSDDNDISHHLSDCLWSIMVLADKYSVDLEKNFIETMNKLEAKIAESE